MPTYEIPLTPEAQTFTTQLLNATYKMTLLWNSASNSWVLDIADKNGAPLISGIPVVANTDLLAPFGHMNFGGTLIAQTDNSPNIPPTYDNLGSTGHLYFTTP